MSEIRKRKHGYGKKDKQNRNGTRQLEEEKTKPAIDYPSFLLEKTSWSVFDTVSLIVGISIAIMVGAKFASYSKELHENDMWFSNIGQVEREISFRTESGLYFSYYKQLVLAPSLSDGLFSLTHDNKTEHLRTINILNRFNVYQEVILGILYRILPIKDKVEYVYFYINTIFGLHGMYVLSIFIGAWVMSDSWCAGLLGALLYIFNRVDTTRLSFTIPLRESFSLPFIFLQIAVLTMYFKEPISPLRKMVLLFLLHVATFFIVLTWQFAQFVLLLEGFAVFGAWCLDLIPRRKGQMVFFSIAGSLIAVCLLQFINEMLVTSLALSFSLSAITIMMFQNQFESGAGIFRKMLRIFTLVTGVLTMSITINLVVKWALGADSDEHVFKFLMSKFSGKKGLARDFDSLLYLCEGAFQAMPMDTFFRLTEGVVFPIYAISMVVVAMLLVIYVYERSVSEKASSNIWLLNMHPEIGFNFVLSVFFGIMAMSTLRMKFLWTPHMCLFAAGVFCQTKVWQWGLWKIEVKDIVAKVVSHLVPCCLITLLMWNRLPPALKELEELREFYDPDTVDLMNWIKSSTPQDAAFTGSMQLLAGVKLCTDRPITNHPHYENKFLRQRTKEVYQIYARRKPKDVANILKKHGSSYIILENSICYSQQDRGCRLPDILDIDNGDELEKGVGTSGPNQIPRFCHAIKFDEKTFRRYFKKVFENKTFYVYQVLN